MRNDSWIEWFQVHDNMTRQTHGVSLDNVDINGLGINIICFFEGINNICSYDQVGTN